MTAQPRIAAARFGLPALLRDRGIQVLSLLALLLIWWMASVLVGTFGGHSILPGPIDVAPRFVRLITTWEFFTPLIDSLKRTAYGFVVAFIIGLIVGITSAQVPLFKTATALTMNVLLFAPTLVIIYLGTAMIGASDLTVAVLAGFLVAPIVSIFMRDVMADFDPELAAMCDSYRVPTRQRVVEVYIPYLVPPILAAARICFSQSWKIVMLTEVFGIPRGIGFAIRTSYDIFDLPRMMSYLIVFVVALLVIEQGIRIIEHRLVKWQR